jgi:hypothetical protein
MAPKTDKNSTGKQGNRPQPASDASGSKPAASSGKGKEREVPLMEVGGSSNDEPVTGPSKPPITTSKPPAFTPSSADTLTVPPIEDEHQQLGGIPPLKGFDRDHSPRNAQRSAFEHMQPRAEDPALSTDDSNPVAHSFDQDDHHHHVFEESSEDHFGSAPAYLAGSVPRHPPARRNGVRNPLRQPSPAPRREDQEPFDQEDFDDHRHPRGQFPTRGRSRTPGNYTRNTQRHQHQRTTQDYYQEDLDSLDDAPLMMNSAALRGIAIPAVPVGIQFNRVFTGDGLTDDDSDIREFLKELLMFLRLHRYPEEDLNHLIQYYLKGTALSVFPYLRKKTLKETTRALIERFSTGMNTPSDWHTKLIKLSTTPFIGDINELGDLVNKHVKLTQRAFGEDWREQGDVRLLVQTIPAEILRDMATNHSITRYSFDSADYEAGISILRNYISEKKSRDRLVDLSIHRRPKEIIARPTGLQEGRTFRSDGNGVRFAQNEREEPKKRSTRTRVAPPEPKPKGTASDYIQGDLAQWFDKMQIDADSQRELESHLINVIQRDAEMKYQERLNFALRRGNYHEVRDQLGIHSNSIETFQSNDFLDDEMVSAMTAASYMQTPNHNRTIGADHFACWYCGERDCSAGSCRTAARDDQEGIIRYSFGMSHIYFPMEGKFLPGPLVQRGRDAPPYRKVAAQWILSHPNSKTCQSEAFHRMWKEHPDAYWYPGEKMNHLIKRIRSLTDRGENEHYFFRDTTISKPEGPEVASAIFPIAPTLHKKNVHVSVNLRAENLDGGRKPPDQMVAAINGARIGLREEKEEEEVDFGRVSIPSDLTLQTQAVKILKKEVLARMKMPVALELLLQACPSFARELKHNVDQYASEVQETRYIDYNDPKMFMTGVETNAVTTDASQVNQPSDPTSDASAFSRWQAQTLQEEILSTRPKVTFHANPNLISVSKMESLRERLGIDGPIPGPSVLVNAASHDRPSDQMNTSLRIDGRGRIDEDEGLEMEPLQNLPWIYVRLHDQDKDLEPALVDSGSEANMITEAVARYYGIKWQPASGSSVSYSSNRVLMKGLAHVRIYLGNTWITQPMYVVQNTTSIKVLLGMPFIRAAKVGFNYDDNRMQMTALFGRIRLIVSVGDRVTQQVKATSRFHYDHDPNSSQTMTNAVVLSNVMDEGGPERWNDVMPEDFEETGELFRGATSRDWEERTEGLASLETTVPQQAPCDQKVPGLLKADSAIEKERETPKSAKKDRGEEKDDSQEEPQSENGYGIPYSQNLWVPIDQSEDGSQKHEWQEEDDLAFIPME